MRKSTLVIISLCLYWAASAQTEDSIKLSNAVLYYSVEGSGQPVLLLSGGPGTSANILDQLFHTLSKSYRCILLEQRGTGKSKTYPMDSSTINLKNAVEDIIALLNKLRLKKISIVGHSYGAMLAMQFASTYPGMLDKLVLVGPGVLSPDQDFAADNRRSKLSVDEILFSRKVQDSIANNTASDASQKKMDAMSMRLNLYDAFKADSILQVINKRQRSPLMERLMLMDMKKNYNVRSAVAKFTFPFMVISGRQDPVAVFPTMEIMQLNRSAKVVWINRSGHIPWLEQPKSFYETIIPFLNQDVSSRAR
jgi:proline iminopeptidase